MKTLIILSHPNIDESGSQQFLMEAIKGIEDVTFYNLEKKYPDGNISVKDEQMELMKYDRILFQFPFYWYSSPPLLKKWQDEVLTDHFAFGYRGNKLEGKEFGLVLIIGLAEKEYQTGGQEGFSISELTKPYQAMALKTGMHYLKPFTLFQFPYKTETEKMSALISYQQYVTLRNADSLKSREEWIIQALDKTDLTHLSTETGKFVLEEAADLIDDNRIELDELRLHIDNAE